MRGALSSSHTNQLACEKNKANQFRRGGNMI
uniref:Uncharacterized protein n=1 Tax=Arundo donax TaxID=35708 RepID=A0A0A9CH40_ARUDO